MKVNRNPLQRERTYEEAHRDGINAECIKRTGRTLEETQLALGVNDFSDILDENGKIDFSAIKRGIDRTEKHTDDSLYLLKRSEEERSKPKLKDDERTVKPVLSSKAKEELEF